MGAGTRRALAPRVRPDVMFRQAENGLTIYPRPSIHGSWIPGRAGTNSRGTLQPCSIRRAKTGPCGGAARPGRRSERRDRSDWRRSPRPAGGGGPSGKDRFDGQGRSVRLAETAPSDWRGHPVRLAKSDPSDWPGRSVRRSRCGCTADGRRSGCRGGPATASRPRPIPAFGMNLRRDARPDKRPKSGSRSSYRSTASTGRWRCRSSPSSRPWDCAG